MTYQDHADYVQRVRTFLEGKGYLFTGPTADQADIMAVQMVAYGLRDEGVGLFEKAGEATFVLNGRTFKYNRVVYRDGRLIKIFTNSGPNGDNNPEWAVESEANDEDAPRYVELASGPFAEFYETHDEETGVTPSNAAPWDIIVLLNKIDSKLDALKVQIDANTEKIQTQIDTVVKNAEKSAKVFIGEGGLADLLRPFLNQR